MTLHLEPEEEFNCSNCSIVYIPYLKYLPCPSCGVIPKEVPENKFFFIGHIISNLRFNKLSMEVMFRQLG